MPMRHELAEANRANPYPWIAGIMLGAALFWALFWMAVDALWPDEKASRARARRGSSSGPRGPASDPMFGGGTDAVREGALRQRGAGQGGKKKGTSWQRDLLAAAKRARAEAARGADGSYVVSEKQRQAEAEPFTGGSLAPYVPTRPHVVAAVLDTLSPGRGSRVVDLGCGDGRFCIDAAERFGARCRGFDLDEALIEKARNLAREKGLLGPDGAEFEVRDIATVDWSDDDHVIVFLLPGPMRKIRTRLLEVVRRGGTVTSIQWPVPELADEIDVGMDRHQVGKASLFFIYRRQE